MGGQLDRIFPRWQSATKVYYIDCQIVYLLVVNKFLSLYPCPHNSFSLYRLNCLYATHAKSLR